VFGDPSGPASFCKGQQFAVPASIAGVDTCSVHPFLSKILPKHSKVGIGFKPLQGLKLKQRELQRCGCLMVTVLTQHALARRPVHARLRFKLKFPTFSRKISNKTKSPENPCRTNYRCSSHHQSGVEDIMPKVKVVKGSKSKVLGVRGRKRCSGCDAECAAACTKCATFVRVYLQLRVFVCCSSHRVRCSVYLYSVY